MEKREGIEGERCGEKRECSRVWGRGGREISEKGRYREGVGELE